MDDPHAPQSSAAARIEKRYQEWPGGGYRQSMQVELVFD
ncbi:MAG: hypothetical protein JWN13_1854 [Betaproteobacteria bacterium]|jgi:hypothetical protein|nr:hypothetical protein [Betaproteobacteria bacterium]